MKIMNAPHTIRWWATGLSEHKTCARLCIVRPGVPLTGATVAAPAAHRRETNSLRHAWVWNGDRTISQPYPPPFHAKYVLEQSYEQSAIDPTTLVSYGCDHERCVRQGDAPDPQSDHFRVPGVSGELQGLLYLDLPDEMF